MKRIAILARDDRRDDRPDAGAVVTTLVGWLRERKLGVVMDDRTAALITPAGGDRGFDVVPRSALAEHADLIVVLGGDGTLLSAARLVGGRDVPILGVNLGGLGFLTATTLEALRPTLDGVLRGDYQAEARMLLRARLLRGGETVAEQLALNDVILAKGALGRLIELEVRMDGQPMTAYRADGLIIATPTGSTAYNLSADGPILFPTMDAVVLTPICSHALTNRPIALPGTAALEVTLLSNSPDVVVSVDGQPGPRVAARDVLAVDRAPARIRLIRDPQKTYFQVLRAKLKWGER